MLNISNVKRIMEEQYPDRVVNRIALYKNDYLVSAPLKQTDFDYNDPYFLVSERGVKQFLPILDMEGFNESFRNRVVYSSN